MNGRFSFDELVALAGSSLRNDVACPRCGPQPGRTDANRKRRVLRIWHPEPGFATFHCERCGISGYAIDGGREPMSRAVIEERRRKAEAFDRDQTAQRRSLARLLWRERRKPIAGTVAERYLRTRGFSGAIPGTLGFLPATNDHPPSLIAAFGIPSEPEPGVLTIAARAILGVHITRLKADGSGKDERVPAKIMIAQSLGWPIVLAPANDGGGLAIAEGIEDGLSIAAVTGLGMWVAGSASRLPALAWHVPNYIDDITIFADSDADGVRHARELERRLRGRGLSAAIAKLPGVTR